MKERKENREMIKTIVKGATFTGETYPILKNFKSKKSLIVLFINKREGYELSNMEYSKERIEDKFEVFH